MKLTRIIVQALFIYSNAHAGTDLSGGGSAVVCFNSRESYERTKSNQNEVIDEDLKQISFVETLDLYQARFGQGSSRKSEIVELPNNNIGSEPLEIAAQDRISLLQRIETQIAISRNLSPLYHNGTLDDFRFTSSSVSQIRDENIRYSLPQNCVLSTIAHRFVESGRTFFLIDERIFTHEKFSRLSRASLLLHEHIYKAATEKLKHSTSDKSRELVASILQKNSTPGSLYRIAVRYGFLKGEAQEVVAYNRIVDGVFWVSRIGYYFSQFASVFELEARQNPYLRPESVITDFLEDLELEVGHKVNGYYDVKNLISQLPNSSRLIFSQRLEAIFNSWKQFVLTSIDAHLALETNCRKFYRSQDGEQTSWAPILGHDTKIFGNCDSIRIVREDLSRLTAYLDSRAEPNLVQSYLLSTWPSQTPYFSTNLIFGLGEGSTGYLEVNYPFLYWSLKQNSWSRIELPTEIIYNEKNEVPVKKYTGYVLDQIKFPQFGENWSEFW